MAGSRFVPLTQGKFAIVDASDFERVMNEGSWHAVRATNRVTYACRAMRGPDGRRKKVGLHSFLTGWDRVDHISGDGLDNRRSNMRQATQSQNMANVPLNSRNRSGFKGVSWAQKSQKWMASIKVAGHSYNLGYYVDPKDAAAAYDEAAVLHFGEFARLNHPEQIVALATRG